VKHHTIGRLVKHKNPSRAGQTGIVVSERLKETYDETGLGGCFVPQVKVEWLSEGKQQWLSRKLLKWSFEDESGDIKWS